MLISISLLKNSLKNYNKVQKNHKETYSFGQAAEAGTSAAFVSFFLVISYIFVILEVILLFYAINMAIVCTEGGPERIVNIVLAVTFTIPYVMLNILFNDCAKQTLKIKSK